MRLVANYLITVLKWKKCASKVLLLNVRSGKIHTRITKNASECAFARIFLAARRRPATILCIVYRLSIANRLNTCPNYHKIAYDNAMRILTNYTTTTVNAHRQTPHSSSREEAYALYIYIWIWVHKVCNYSHSVCCVSVAGHAFVAPTHACILHATDPSQRHHNNSSNGR